MKLGHFFAKIIKIQSGQGLVSQPSPPALCMIMIPKYSGGATLHSDAETLVRKDHYQDLHAPVLSVSQPACSLYDYDYAPCTPNIAAVPHSDADTSQGNLGGENKFDLSLHIGQIGPRGKAAQPSPAPLEFRRINRYFCCVLTK